MYLVVLIAVSASSFVTMVNVRSICLRIAEFMQNVFILRVCLRSTLNLLRRFTSHIFLLYFVQYILTSGV